MTKDALESIGEGLCKNQTLTHLILRENDFEEGADTVIWRDCFGIFTLKSVDFSGNVHLSDSSVLNILRGLQ